VIVVVQCSHDEWRQQISNADIDNNLTLISIVPVLEKGSTIGVLLYGKSAVQWNDQNRVKLLVFFRFAAQYRGLPSGCNHDLAGGKNLCTTISSAVSIAYGEEGGSRGRWKRVQDDEHSRVLSEKETSSACHMGG